MTCGAGTRDEYEEVHAHDRACGRKGLNDVWCQDQH